MSKARQNREVPQGKSPGYSTLSITLFGYGFTYISESEKDRVNRAVLTDCTRAHGPSWITEIRFGIFFVLLGVVFVGAFAAVAISVILDKMASNKPTLKELLAKQTAVQN